MNIHWKLLAKAVGTVIGITLLISLGLVLVLLISWWIVQNIGIVVFPVGGLVFAFGYLISEYYNHLVTNAEHEKFWKDYHEL